jgi:hypothetical protein
MLLLSRTKCHHGTMPVVGPRRYFVKRSWTKQSAENRAAASGQWESMSIYSARFGRLPPHLTDTVGDSLVMLVGITKE